MERFQDLLRVPGVQMPKFPLTTFENSSLCVIGWVERSVLWCLHRAGGCADTPVLLQMSCY